jgi:hypothetical protein
MSSIAHGDDGLETTDGMMFWNPYRTMMYHGNVYGYNLEPGAENMLRGKNRFIR